MPFAFLTNCGLVWILPTFSFYFNSCICSLLPKPSGTCSVSWLCWWARLENWLNCTSDIHPVGEWDRSYSFFFFFSWFGRACSVDQNVFILGSGERLAIAAEETRCFPFYLLVLLLLFCWFLHLFSSLPYGQSYLFWYFSLPWTCYYYFFPLI